MTHAACTWLLNDVTPSLTLADREVFDVVELIELMESWLPLRSRDKARPSLLMEVRRTGVAMTPVALVTL